MKILLIAPQPFLEKRGTPLAVLQLLRALTELGHSVDLVTYHLGDDVAIPGVTHHRIRRIPFIRSVKKGISAAKLFLDLFVFCKALGLLRKRSYDCIHGVEEAAIMGGVLKRFYRAPLVYDMDSSIPEQLGDSTSPFWSSAPVVGAASLLEKWTINRADLVLAVCQALRERVKRVSPGKRVELLEDIPNVEPFTDGLKGAFELLRRELGIGDERVVLYTGTFEAYQGIELLLEAVPLVTAEYPPVRFILVGGEPDQVRDKQARAGQLGIADKVMILGKRPLEEMPLFMEMADILVSPRNKGTNTPMKIYTYLQSGRPVVATRLLTHTQVLTDDISVLVEPEPAAFAAGIAHLLKREEIREEIGRKGAAFVEEHFSFASFKAKIKGAYSLLQT